MLISQDFNPETANLETFVEHCESTETTDDIAGAKFIASDKDSDQRKKNEPSLRTSMVRNARSVPPSSIALSMERILVTPQGSATFSSLKARKSQSSLKRTSRKTQGSQSPREESLSAEGKVPQVQEPEQGVLQERDSGHSIGL